MTKSIAANKQIINKLIDLYFTQTKKYLIQTSQGNYITFDTRNKTKKGKSIKPLMDWQLDSHLKGHFTIGTFGGKFKSKVITFDIDFVDVHMSKWIAYCIANTLDQQGIHEYYISYSGRKGYHIDIFIDDLILIDDAVRFFELIIEESGVKKYFKSGRDINKLIIDGFTVTLGDVEFRPYKDRGLKLPLGVHQVTKQFCGFCNIENGLKVKNEEDSIHILLNARKIKSNVIYDILSKCENEIRKIRTSKVTKSEILETEQSIASHKQLPIYEQSDEQIIDSAISLLNNGLKVKSSRHNSLFKLARYLLYIGNESNEAKSILYDWMERQDKSFYETSLEQCYRDIDEIIEYVYGKNIGVTVRKRNIQVTYNEVEEIIYKCPEKNQKLIIYAMLVHSKRFALMNGVFYMTYEHLEEATGLRRQALIAQITKLYELGVVEIVQRNKKQKGTYKKAVNKYKLLIHIDTLSITETFNTDQDNNFVDCLECFYTKEQLARILPRRQYSQLMAR